MASTVDLPADFTPPEWPDTKPGKRRVLRRVIAEHPETGALTFELEFQYGTDDGEGGFVPLPGREGKRRKIIVTGATAAAATSVDAGATKNDLDQITHDVLDSEGF